MTGLPGCAIGSGTVRFSTEFFRGAWAEETPLGFERRREAGATDADDGRLRARVCNTSEECKLFPDHQYVPDIDSLGDIRCASDAPGFLGTSDCAVIGANLEQPEDHE